MVSSVSFANLSLYSLRGRVALPTSSRRGGAPGRALRISTRIPFYLMVALFCTFPRPVNSKVSRGYFEILRFAMDAFEINGIEFVV